MKIITVLATIFLDDDNPLLDGAVVSADALSVALDPNENTDVVVLKLSTVQADWMEYTEGATNTGPRPYRRVP